ncbi:MAG: aminotransferase class III-fold pyridoxal phosphate-dependent enzyme [Candidatus Thorarchaeota archaeon]|nr:MAG: aminotransferase class III-fold pyridoxal phosphate-dependent enzyme [Candidatus Thorarchaeota archaeon]
MLDKYKSSSPKSGNLWRRALQVFPGGVNHNIRTFGLDSCGAYPPYVSKGQGSHIWDVDGNEYVDWWMTHYAQILGHNDPNVRKALKDQIERGLHFGAPNESQVILAEKLAEAIPFMEKMRFCSTGAESTMYAVRLARLFTKRRLVAKTLGGWHGGNDSLGYHLKHPFTDAPFFDGVSFNFNDIDSFDSLLAENGNELAAVVIEPVQGAGGALEPESGFLPYIREETEKRGIILIYDEIISGFRFCYGSAGDKLFSTVPDMITLGKIAGGGMHLGVYGGREDIMSLATPGIEGGRWVGGGTFSSHPLAMAAGSVTLDELRSRRDKYDSLNRKATDFRAKVNAVFDGLRARAISTGYGSLTYIHWLHTDLGEPPFTGRDLSAASDHDTMDKFQGLLMQEGIFGYHGLGALSFSHSDDDIGSTLSAIESVSKSMV